MSQPDDDDTKEHPPYGSPPEGTAPAEQPAAEPPPAEGAFGEARPADAESADAPIAESPTTELQVPPPTSAQPPSPPSPPGAQWQQPGQWQQWQQPGQQWQQPGQQWQGPPPGQQGWQQPPPGWQQQPGQWRGAPPSYPPPGWAPQTQAYAGPQYSTSALVALAGLLLVVFGLVIAVAGGWGFTQGNELGRFVREYADRIAIFGQRVDRDTLRTFLSAMPTSLVITGIAQLLIGAGVVAHKGWARGLGVLLSLLGLLVGVFAVSAALALAPGLSVPMLIAIVLLLGYAYVLLALLAGSGHFRARYAGR